MSKLSLGNGALMDCISVNVLAGVTGSASGGMSIALEALATKLLATGVDPAVLHRIASVSSGCLATLQQNGAVLTLLAVAGLTHKDSYKDIFVVSLVIPVLASLILVLLSTLGLNA
jgi:H+/gluconate symporter-like permease